MLGEIDLSIDALSLAIERGWPFYYAEMGPEDPMLENVADDPRFIELMDGLKAGLDEEREWALGILALPESERFAVMMADAEAQLEAMWAEARGAGN